MRRGERRRQIDLCTVPFHGCATDRLARRVGDQLLGQPHHVEVIGKGLVQLQHRELGIVPGRQAFVAEHARELEHAVVPADDESLEVELGRDPQRKLHVERVVMRREGPRGRTARDRVQHRRLDFEESALGEKPAHRTDGCEANVEDPAGVVVRDEIDITLPVARVGVGEPVPLLRQRAERLRQQLKRLHVDGELAELGLHDLALDADPVAAFDLVTETRELVRPSSP